MNKIGPEALLIILGVILIIYGHPIIGIFLILLGLGFFA
jgi:hypothetical protein